MTVIKDKLKTRLAEVKRLQTELAKQATLIAKENAAFAAMSDADKRIAIAHDVILQIRSGALNAQTGTGYVRLDHSIYPDEDRDITEETELKEVLCKQDCCTVCARGAMFVAAVKRFNHVQLQDVYVYNGQEFGSDDIRKYEDNFFSSDQIEEIENYFEGGGNLDEAAWNADTHGWDLFEGDGDQDNDDWYGDPDTLLIAIMKNIIENKGTFVPEKMKREVKREAFYAAQKKKMTAKKTKGKKS